MRRIVILSGCTLSMLTCLAGCWWLDISRPRGVGEILIGYKYFAFPAMAPGENGGPNHLTRIGVMLEEYWGSCCDFESWGQTIEKGRWCDTASGADTTDVFELSDVFRFSEETQHGRIGPRDGSVGGGNFVYWFVQLWNYDPAFRNVCRWSGMQCMEDQVGDATLLDIENLNWTEEVFVAYQRVTQEVGLTFGDQGDLTGTVEAPHGIFVVDMPDDAYHSNVLGMRIPGVRVVVINLRLLERFLASLYSQQKEINICDIPDLYEGLSFVTIHELFHYLCGPPHHLEMNGGDCTNCAMYTGTQIYGSRNTSCPLRIIPRVCNECWSWVGHNETCEHIIADAIEEGEQ